ncbi:uncharacterized protein [Spinacia oleracea]|uniref:Uncharacterized protein isoform X2 n=1 Tax=Spinacia oleracea TaxID=3562 RepID=A0ABM3R599_SPIOL|nr:uncharacterized protein LOC110776149 isoform X2 [Spinacia oleracea]
MEKRGRPRKNPAPPSNGQSSLKVPATAQPQVTPVGVSPVEASLNGSTAGAVRNSIQPPSVRPLDLPVTPPIPEHQPISRNGACSRAFSQHTTNFVIYFHHFFLHKDISCKQERKLSYCCKYSHRQLRFSSTERGSMECISKMQISVHA